MLGLTHPLHRRRVCLGIQKIKDKEEEEVREHAQVFAPAAAAAGPPGAGNVDSTRPRFRFSPVQFVACVSWGRTRDLKREVVVTSL